MILKGKAKEAFEKWFDDYSQKHHQKEWLNNDLYLDEVYLPDELINSLIIQWLDSVGIYVDIQLLPHFDEAEIVSVCWYVNVATSYCSYNSDDHYPTRQQATEKAIESAFELFNESSER